MQSIREFKRKNICDDEQSRIDRKGSRKNFRSDCLSEKNFEVNLQNWKDNGGCLPALDAGGHRFESYFPDNLLHSSNGLGRLPFEQ